MTTTRIGRAGLLAFLLLSATVSRAEKAKPLWLVVTRPAFVESLAPLLEHRRGEGFETRISTASVAKTLADMSRPPAFLLLVGDEDPAAGDTPWRVPSPRRELYRWRAVQARTFAADALLGDLDGDLRPDVPVGRIPARTPGDVIRVVAKILAYERQAPTEEDLRLPILGGAPGYGPRLDAMASGLLVTTVRKHAPGWASPWMISAGAGQPLCGWPPDHPVRFAQALRRGGVLAAVLAHAGEDSILSMRHQGRSVLLDRGTTDEAFASGPPSSPLVLLTCLTGRFSRARESLSESMLFAPGGPVAVIGATAESHPLTNYLSGVGVLGSLDVSEDLPRLGTFWREAQRSAFEARDPLIEMMLRDVEGKLEEDIDVAKLRRDQLLMYALLGDPATRLRLPRLLRATVEKISAGWRWSIERPEGATRLSVGFRPFGAPSTVPAKGPLDAETARKLFEKANGKFAYRPLPGPGPGEPWGGVWSERGHLRLVATGPGLFHVAVIELR